MLWLLNYPNVRKAFFEDLVEEAYWFGEGVLPELCRRGVVAEPDRPGMLVR